MILRARQRCCFFTTWKGELFFGAAPELDRCFAQLKQRTRDENIGFVVLRLKRTRNPDMVSMERFDHFLHDMQVRVA